ncbi:6-carboxytetrahydropterin synthase QueD [Adlercreutzia sp. ZJ304]|uniref:6-carboxytetrahydropterin synthase QueD n=1 Tax=Adlercreutzia sp. ZJ304 TaxID=2709791 RepID=UPI0013EAEAAF|nr:6-carboxytetrahydropterin synthase QueD [Adlercreutzia sp. ZJ304]
MYELKTEAFFDSAHFLADYYGKCENLHGHRWRIEVTISSQTLGDEGTERDMVCDFSQFKRIVRSLADEFDHTFLIEEGTLKKKTIRALESEGFSLKMLPFRTTAENLARFFFDCLIDIGLPVTRVEVDETPNNCAIFYK